jgi:hypothetical protein
MSVSEFQNFVNSAANTSDGTGTGYMGPPPNVFPPVNMSQSVVSYKTPLPSNVILPSNNVSNTNNILNPLSSSSSSSSSPAPIDRYGRFRNYTFNPNFDTTNYGAAYDPAKRASKIYNKDLQSRDKYGQDYDVRELDLGGFKDRLKKSKKSRYEAPGMTYGELAAKRATNPNPSDAMWATYDGKNFGDQYEIGRKYRNRSANEIRRERDNALEMYGMLESDPRMDKSDKKVQNLMWAVQNSKTCSDTRAELRLQRV